MPLPAPRPDSAETLRLLDLVRDGKRDALDKLFARHRDVLTAFVDLHLDRAVRGRLDPSDVVQDTQLELVRRLKDFLARRPMPFHLWARKTAYERLLNARRDHRAQCRDVGRDAAIPDSSSIILANRLVAAGPSPSEVADARERADRVARQVETLGDDDREILLLRHVQDLPYDEIGCLLDIDPATARQRYGRALLRLKDRLAAAGLVENTT